MIQEILFIICCVWIWITFPIYVGRFIGRLILKIKGDEVE